MTREYTWITITLLGAFLLTILPLPEWVVFARPQWPLLVVLFWSISSSGRSRIGLAWWVGLLLDLLTGTLLGQNAFTYCLLSYLSVKASRYLRDFSLLPQSIFIFVMTLISLTAQYMIMTLFGSRPIHWAYWLPCITNPLVWPWLCILLQQCVNRDHLRV